MCGESVRATSSTIVPIRPDLDKKKEGNPEQRAHAHGRNTSGERGLAVVTMGAGDGTEREGGGTEDLARRNSSSSSSSTTATAPAAALPAAVSTAASAISSAGGTGASAAAWDGL